MRKLRLKGISDQPKVTKNICGAAGAPHTVRGTTSCRLFGVIYNITSKQGELATRLPVFRHFDPQDFVML